MGGCQSKPTAATASTKKPSSSGGLPASSSSRNSVAPGPPQPQQPSENAAAAAAAARPKKIQRTPSPTKRATNSGSAAGHKATSNGQAGLPRSLSPKKHLHHHHHHAVTTDARWRALYHAYKPVDPADVHSVVDDLISQQISLLSPAEVTFVLRAVRHVGNAVSPPPNNSNKLTMGKRLGLLNSYSNHNSSNRDGPDARTVRDRHHMLEESLIRKLWSFKNAPSCAEWQMRMEHSQDNNNNKTVDNNDLADPIGAAHVLMLHLSNESLWDRVASIAEESAAQVGLVLDVNHPKPKKDVPLPHQNKVQPSQEAMEMPPGVKFRDVCFLASLALRGTRMQRLQLLFYLLLPPKILMAFLASHPAGGIPSWLLEVDRGGVVLSLGSLSHYYYFGTAFLPTISEEENSNIPDRKGTCSLVVSAWDSMETIANLLCMSSGSDAQNATVAERRVSGSAHGLRSGSRQGDGTTPGLTSQASSSSLLGDWSSAVSSRDSVVMEVLQDIREGRQVSYMDEALKESVKQFWEACEPHLKKNGHHHRRETWTTDAFAEWAQFAIDDAALDAIMHRLFATGAIPSHFTEKELVVQQWKQWQQTDLSLWTPDEEPQDMVSYLSHSMHHLFQMKRGDASQEQSPLTSVWGGIGGFDGRGGLGKGIAYCIEKKWWDAWADYVGWEWEGKDTVQQRSRTRPGELSTEAILDRSQDSPLAGTLGSYEMMKSGLVKGRDFVLIPACVWDVLYGLYGGGPPLPRMVLPPPVEPRERTFSADSKQMEDEDYMFAESSVEVVASPTKLRQVPDAFSVATHPWVLHCQICDAQQPYRRGEAGPISIRIMATPDQPLWRLYAEIIMRLPVHNIKAFRKEGRGQARLWRRFDPTNAKDAMSRYGPWSLMCKNRAAILPKISNHSVEFNDNYDELKRNWQAYADHATVEGIGLSNGDRLMMEYAVLNKELQFVWPREAAAKAGRVRRLEEEDLKFRRTLKGVDENDSPIDAPPSLVGMKVDAMDISGRWFQVKILQVQTLEDEEEEDADHDNDEKSGSTDEKETSGEEKEKKYARVDFTDFGGHPEWISIESDRLAVAGRFTLNETEKEEDEPESKTNGKNSSDTKGKTSAASKKTSSDTGDQNGGKLCPFPGYGACGLANLGNTCYANSAIQCISYMPLLRAYLLSAQYKAEGDLNRDNPLGSGGKLLEEFADLLRMMWSGKYGEKSPSRFRSNLGKARPQFSGADQQDAQEVLNYMLDILHEDSNKVKKKPFVEAVEDDWVKANSLPRVADETWRRFLRRNRSIMADVAMGQVLNTVTCPVCHFSSRNFDPFNLLSIPFPTVADVVLKCIVIRRGTAHNCPNILNLPKRGDSIMERFGGRKVADDPRPPSSNLIQEQYAIALSRLADIGDLMLQLQNVCGIPSNKLKMYKVEDEIIDKNAKDSDPIKNRCKITPCPDGTKIASFSEDADAATKTATRIIAFETTLHPRPLRTSHGLDDDDADGGTGDATEADESSEEDDDDKAYFEKERRLLQESLKHYGDKTECRVFDTDPLLISKAISRSLWPTTADEIKLGLRVDAIDHRDHWFSGSVVEIIDAVPSELDQGSSDEEKADAVNTKVRIHFDNFSSKWDETYTIDHFTRGQVRPLYSHSTPRVRPTEFVVHHRFHNKQTKTNVLFGQPFNLQCHTEWSTARAGAHILAQASRFLLKPSEGSSNGPVDVDTIVEADSKASRIYHKAQNAISDLIDLLVECDRSYTRGALGIPDHGAIPDDHKYRNPGFDATAMSTALVKRVGSLLHRLPFEVRLCSVDSPTGNKGPSSEDCPFPFSLMRTIGNFMNARHALALHWREHPLDRKGKSTLPIMYIPPPLAIHKASAAMLEDVNSKTRKSKNSPGSGGLHLSVCLNEFCKEQQLGLSDCWRCPQCKDYREGKQNMHLWRLPDLLTFHIKRFNCSARWREKITTKVNFPLTGLDISEWCHNESPALAAADGSYVYDLIGVLNHYGSMTGGHYVAACKATACSPEGSEEVAFGFQGAGANVVLGGDLDAGDLGGSGDDKPGWRLGVRKDKDTLNQQNRASAAAASRAVSESAEPLWLQFDDELVEPIPPRSVVSEMAYVLFYRRRRLTSSSIAKYSTLG